MKKNRVIFGWVLLCLISFLLGRESVQWNISKEEEQGGNIVMEVTPTQTEPKDVQSQTYYYLKIENNMLMIYEMPERKLYESVSLESLWIPEEEAILKSGMKLDTLMEVYEFLENRMS
mgnify:CR=1 FL=1